MSRIFLANNEEVKPFHVFLIEGGGVGKSHILKTIYMPITKVIVCHGIKAVIQRI